jgi:uncharacterized DUF497 family protein
MNIASKLGLPGYEFRLVLGRTRIDYDQNKDKLNRATHGYSLESAAYYLERLTFPTGRHHPYVITDAFREKNEIRHIHMTVDDKNNVVVMVTTMRSKDSDEVVRIISLRRAHLNEREKFKQLTGYIQPQR